MKEKRKYRVIILGAGFSKPAGLPLAEDLWQEILIRCKTLSGRASMLNDDIDAFIEYRKDCNGIELSRDTVDFEELLGFLNIEHYLGLRGKDTWSRDGNEGQVVVKTLIGEILTKYMPTCDNIPELYLEFARYLQPNDYILTFNYDVLLERALDAVGKPYRLFPDRYESVSRSGGVIDSSKEEVIIRKFHGSIDWFDKTRYIENVQNYKEHGIKEPPTDIVFNSEVNLIFSKIVDGPRHDNDPLLNMYLVADIERLYRKRLMFIATPWIILPSTNKIIYTNQLHDFWYGLGVSGGYNFGMAIVGYSLPHHDNYTKQTIYSLIRNYQDEYWDEIELGLKKTPLVLVDYKETPEKVDNFKRHYRFVNFDKAVLHLDGFNMEAIKKYSHEWSTRNCT